MKKNVWLRMLTALSLALYMLLASGAALAEQAGQPIATAYKTAELTLDGKLDEWNMGSPIVLKEPAQMVRDADFWNGPDDLSATFYIAWDETYFYLAADVIEDSVFGAIETLPVDGVDNFEIFLSTNPADDPARTEFGSNDFLIFLVMDGEYWDTAIDRSMVPKENRGRFISKGMEGGENVLEGYECAAELTAMGFTYECRIPWSCFVDDRGTIAGFTPTVGDTVNFDVLVTDISYPCPGTEFIPQIAWTGGLDIKTDPSQWGRLTFAE